MLARTLALIILTSSFAVADPVFQEKRGLVVMEAESTSSSLGRWKKKTNVEGFSGDCHLEFTGNKTESGPPVSDLKYTFQINKGGKYTLALRAHKRLESKRQDISNDCYVAMKGDFEPGGSAPHRVLKDDTKLFGGDATGWGSAHTLDANHKKYPAEYLFKAGETYTLTIHGRSKNFNIDRIFLVHDSLNLREVQKKNPKESDTDGGAPAEAEPRREKRILHNKDGATINAEIAEVNGNILVAYVKGKRYEIPIDSLSEEDQAFLKSWNK